MRISVFLLLAAAAIGCVFADEPSTPPVLRFQLYPTEDDCQSDTNLFSTLFTVGNGNCQYSRDTKENADRPVLARPPEDPAATHDLEVQFCAYPGGCGACDTAFHDVEYGDCIPYQDTHFAKVTLVGMRAKQDDAIEVVDKEWHEPSCYSETPPPFYDTYVLDGKNPCVSSLEHPEFFSLLHIDSKNGIGMRSECGDDDDCNLCNTHYDTFPLEVCMEKRIWEIKTSGASVLSPAALTTLLALSAGLLLSRYF